MKLHEVINAEVNRISAYGDSYVEVNEHRYSSTLFMTPNEIVTLEEFDGQRTSTDIETLLQPAGSLANKIAELGCDILLVGTGKRQRFPTSELLVHYASQRIGLEIMDNRAACRTFNILVAEERRVGVLLSFGAD